MTEAQVGEWYKKEGDSVSLDEALVELETDKAAMDAAASSAASLPNCCQVR
ncbi:MAG: biotin/lipoyl-containing protein [Parvularculaceae bacterium]